MQSNSCKVGHAGHTYPLFCYSYSKTPVTFYWSRVIAVRGKSSCLRVSPFFSNLCVTDCTPKPPQTAPPLGTKSSNVCAYIQTSIYCYHKPAHLLYHSNTASWPPIKHITHNWINIVYTVSFYAVYSLSNSQSLSLFYHVILCFYHSTSYYFLIFI